MKFKIKILFCFIFLITLIFSVKELSLSYTSEVSLNYDGKSKTFSYSKSNDLFDEFKDLMPGDKREQLVRINLNNIGKNSNMYLKLVEVDLLSDLIIKIYKDDTLIFDNINNINNYDELIKIYENDSPKSFYLKVDLEVPTEVGNEVQSANFKFIWQFVVEDSGKLVDAPQTGVADCMWCYFILLIISLIMIILLIMSIIKESKKNKEGIIQ